MEENKLLLHTGIRIVKDMVGDVKAYRSASECEEIYEGNDSHGVGKEHEPGKFFV